MAGTIKVDSINADSNLALKIANTAVAFIDATGLRPVAGNLNLDATATSKFYLPSANTVAIQTAGVTAVTVDSSQNVTLAGTLTTTGITNSGVATATRFNPTGSSVTGTGMYLPAANSLGFSANGTNAVYIDSSQRIGIGTSSPEANAKMTVYGGGIGISTNGVTTAPTGYDLKIRSNTSILGIHTDSGSGVPTLEFGNGASGYCTIKGTAAVAMTFQTNSTEAMRILSGGQVSVATTSNLGGNFNVDCTNGASFSAYVKSNTSGGAALAVNAVNPCSTHVQWYNSGTPTGSVTWNGASAVAYNTTSDYRLKESIAPMTGALAKVSQLKPCTYKWKLDGADGQGFIAHELAEVVPDCVTGEKDAVDADGNPKYQGIDTSYLVATLTAAIQELKAINDTQAETINALTARIVALETI
jgi:hypothetical protein